MHSDSNYISLQNKKRSIVLLKTQQNIDSLRDEVMNDISPYFSHIDDIAERNTLKILSAFKKYQLSEYHFRSTSGYGYGDAGRQIR